MEIMDTARLNIKKQREIKGLRQQDLADKMCMSLRSYQSLESGETKLDLERLEQIAKVLETNIEELLQPEGIIINQEIKDNATGNNNNGVVYHYGIEETLLNKLMATIDLEKQALKETIKSQTEEIKYLREKLDQLLSNKQEGASKLSYITKF